MSGRAILFLSLLLPRTAEVVGRRIIRPSSRNHSCHHLIMAVKNNPEGGEGGKSPFLRHCFYFREIGRDTQIEGSPFEEYHFFEGYS